MITVSITEALAMLGYSTHITNRGAVYELMHESQRCHTMVDNSPACKPIDAELAIRSERYF